MTVYAIIPAAGLGTRMSAPNTGMPSKQFLSIAGEPILLRTLRQFLSVQRVRKIVVALRASEITTVEDWIAGLNATDRITLTVGGDTRQESVTNALSAINADADDVVLVHDAVRPLITPGEIDHCIAAAEKYGAAIVGLPAVDTVKLVERTAEGALISSTIPRERVVLAQTPQAFRYSILRSAFDQAAADGFIGTDEASVVERAGQPVAVVMGSPSNFKITKPGDLQLAEFHLAERERA